MENLSLCRVLLATGLLLAGCGEGFQPASEVDTLRVLAVRPEPASGSPGETSTLDMLVADGVNTPGAAEGPRPLEIAWLGGCHNPPTRQYFACFPLLSAIASQLAPRVLDTQTENAPPGYFGTGPRFDVLVPSDILSAAVRVSGDPIHFGVSYSFFAVCAGELRPRPDITDRVPLECVDPATGAALGRRDFVSGFTTLYTYEDAKNDNPILSGIRFAGLELRDVACETDADCQGLEDFATAGLAAACGTERRCVPLVSPCAGEDCPKFLVDPLIDQASAEPMPNEAANEIVWTNFFSSAGRFDTGTQLVNDAATGFIEEHGSYFHPPEEAVGEVWLWVTVHDQRGGTTAKAFQILSR